MSSFEINKIMGAIFSVALLILIITNIADTLYHEKENDNVELSATNIEENIEAENVDNINEVNIEQRLANADINEGLKIIKKCEACHTLDKGEKNRLGPNLHNVVSRKIASVENFKYSKALLELNDNWNNENLDKFLENPKKWAPGTKMIFIGLKDPLDRANIIKYLQSLK